ncbi:MULTISPECIES: hypothetical protein [Pectobacterium]|uniref:hypothetical protein n=1 Tax=Pectobacterium TaxID=122277 RepID=UPI000473AF97|nr:hypothetical protein [Pectobacterium parmentieri]MBI0473232.1 hypothetical protein [Pectobacterium parmentieri]MBI0495845.1 hypothetical protein [Pectobacterium parmentieri]MBI0570382.1 hypothetical protein [Pectobacterium parmentieri]MBI0575087.1 hypothetical protein [Pectobacterium parmentieri]
MSTFDSNHKNIIAAFMALKNKATLLEKHTLRGNYQINKNRLPFIEVRNYYASLRNVCDLPIIFMMNEELSNTAARHLCPELLIELLKEQHLTLDVQVDGKPASLEHEDFEASLSDIRALFCDRINGMVGSLMLDFTVSVFSCFEHWITKLYDGYAEKLEAEYKNSRRDKVVKLLKRYGGARSDEEKLKYLNGILDVRGPYRSFPDKINALYKMVDKQKYMRDINHDKDIIKFLGACRNTVHNSGVHQKDSLQITCNGITYFLRAGRPWYCDRYSQSIGLLGELTDIYSHLVRSLSDWPLESVCEEILLQPDMRRFEIAVQLAFDADQAVPLEQILIENMGVGEVQAKNIARILGRIKSDISRDPKDFCIYEILTGDLLNSLETPGSES